MSIRREYFRGNLSIVLLVLQFQVGQLPKSVLRQAIARTTDHLKIEI